MAQPGELMFPDAAGGGGGGGGSLTPGLLMFPAEADTLRAKPSSVAARVDFSLFISVSHVVFRGSQSPVGTKIGTDWKVISSGIITALQISCKESG